MDRGGDRKKLLGPLLEWGERCVIHSTGRRTGDRPAPTSRVAWLRWLAGGRLRHPARIVKIQGGQEKIYELRYGAEPVHLPGRSEKLWLVVIAALGEEPLMLLTDLPVADGTPKLFGESCKSTRRAGKLRKFSASSNRSYNVRKQSL